MQVGFLNVSDQFLEEVVFFDHSCCLFSLCTMCSSCKYKFLHRPARKAHGMRHARADAVCLNFSRTVTSGSSWLSHTQNSCDLLLILKGLIAI